MTKKWNLKFNSKSSTHTFSLYNREKKSGFVFSHFFNRCSLNNNSVAIYKNVDLKEIALVREYNQSNTVDEPKFLSFDDYNNLVKKLDGINDVSDLAILLNRLFNCEFANRNDDYLY
tara:strand:- start:14 stop:364 length:351 start_codon:yes stop_codon:yes gene_type:complete